MKEMAMKTAAGMNELLGWVSAVSRKAGVEDLAPMAEKEVRKALAFYEVECPAAKAAEVSADELPQLIPDTIKMIRMAGQLPYYMTRAAGCWMAAGYGRKVNALEVGGIFKMPYEIQFRKQAADACAAVLDKKPLCEDPKRVALLEKAYEAGYYYEKVYRGCAQCTLGALYEVIGKKNPEVFQMANTFASGMGLFGDGPCGGYSGGLLFLGSYGGRRLEYIDGDQEQKNMAWKLSALMHAKFIDTYGTIVCHGIHQDIFGRKFNLRIPEQKQGFGEAGAHKYDKCPAVVGTAAMWTVEILLDEGFITAE